MIDMRSKRRLTEEEQALSRMTVQQLRNLWDRYDGGNSPGGFSGEAIHIVLNLKGDGSYCAV